MLTMCVHVPEPSHDMSQHMHLMHVQLSICHDEYHCIFHNGVFVLFLEVSSGVQMYILEYI